MAVHVDDELLITYQGLHNCMICCIHVCVEWKRAFAIAVKSSIAFRCNDPILNKKNNLPLLMTCGEISHCHLKISTKMYCSLCYYHLLV